MKKYKLKCKILSPIHIGTGSEIEPFDYIIKENKFYKISLENFLLNLDHRDKEKFNLLVSKNNVNEIRKFIIENWDAEKYAVDFFCDVSPEVNKVYQENINHIENQLLINPFIRSKVNNLPYIPGSTIKGAIRTAIISELAKKKNDIKNIRNIEAEVLNCQNDKGFLDPKKDPFRAIKISDGFLTINSTVILKIVNVSKDKFGKLISLKIQMLNEVTYSYISGKNIEFEAELIIDNNLQQTHFLKTIINIESIKKCCNSFYQSKMADEDKNFYQRTSLEKISHGLCLQEFENNSFLVRIGRFSGVENVTLDKYRDPNVPEGKSWGKTKNICEMKYPLGWLKITFEEVSNV